MLYERFFIIFTTLHERSILHVISSISKKTKE